MLSNFPLRLGYLLLAVMGAFVSLGLVLWSLSLNSAYVQAAPNQQGGPLFWLLPVEKTATRASVYSVTNVTTMTITTTHEFWEVDISFEVETLHHQFSDQLSPQETRAYDLSTIPEIPFGVVNEVHISSDKPITAISDICFPTIRSVGDGDWFDPATWDLNRLPANNDVVMIEPRHTIENGPAFVGGGLLFTPFTIRGLCNFGILLSREQADLGLQATDFISNYGTILGQPGNIGELATLSCGGKGSSLKLVVSNGQFLNTGRINAGDGGGSYKCPGKGGSIFLTAGGVTNEGEICAGSGGNTFDTFAGLGLEVTAGKGGDLLIWSRPGFVRNTGLLCGGDGGRGDIIAESAHNGGDGGKLKIVALPNVFLEGGQHRGGRGGQGRAGGSDGRDGPVIIEPNTISLAGSATSVTGGDIIIFGGDDWLLNLSNMSGAAINASGNITLAVGAGGVVDLRGNASQIFQAAGQVMIASDVISIDGGTTLTDVLGVNFITGPSQILYDVSLFGPGQVVGQPEVTTALSITLLNGGPATDTYTLSWQNAAGWSSVTLPPTMTVEGLTAGEVALRVTPPAAAISGTQNTLTITAVSAAAPNVIAVETIAFSVQDATNNLYLPLVVR